MGQTATFAFTYHGDGVFAVHVRWVVVWEQRRGQAAGRVGVRSVATNFKAIEILERFEVIRLLVLPDVIAVVVTSEVVILVVVGAVVVPEMQKRAIVTTILVRLSGILFETDFVRAV